MDTGGVDVQDGDGLRWLGIPVVRLEGLGADVPAVLVDFGDWGPDPALQRIEHCREEGEQ